MKRMLSVLILLVIVTVGVAQTEVEYRFDSQKKEIVFKGLVKELRCLVCQNQNLDDSNATLARDLKNKIYEAVNQGQTEADIKSYLVKRYGDFILFKPPVKKATLVLWFFPFMMLVIGFIVLRPFIRKEED